MKHSFSFSRLLRRRSKSSDLLNEDPEEAFDVPSFTHEPPTLFTNFDDSESWSSLLGDQPRQSAPLSPTPTQLPKRRAENRHFFASKGRQAGDTATLKPKSEQVHNR